MPPGDGKYYWLERVSVMTRRDVFSTVGLLAAASAAQGQSGDAGTMSFRLGVATYSLRAFQRSLAIKLLRRLAVTEVSVKQESHLPFALSGEDLTKAAGEFKKAGLKIVSCGNTELKSNDPAVLRKPFEHAKTAGVPMLVAAPVHENLAAIERLAMEFDIRVAIHTHGPEDKYFPTPNIVLDAIKGMDPRMGLCLDVGHSMRGGADVVADIARAGRRLLDVHFKDLKNGAEKDSQCDVGEGVMPVLAIFRQLVKVGYRGNVNLEYEINEDDPTPGMLHSLGYMHGVMAALV